MLVAIASRSFLDDPHCGDQVACWQLGPRRALLCIADGLGHGESAETAARAALDYVSRRLEDPLGEIFAGCDAAIRCTRGVAMSIAVVDAEAGSLIYAGVGNTRAIIVRQGDPGSNEPWAHPLRNSHGIVGAGYQRLSPETAALAPGDLLILHTDGIQPRMELAGYDGALLANVRRLAEAILRGWARERDDAAVLVFKEEEAC